MLKFSWDSDKAILNFRKHKVSFLEAETVFDDQHALLISDEDHSDSEDRFVLLGFSIEARLLIVVHCYRDSDEEIRIISARKADSKEANQYERRRGL
jgi:uncharacterized DUF497 family protein